MSKVTYRLYNTDDLGVSDRYFDNVDEAVSALNAIIEPGVWTVDKMEIQRISRRTVEDSEEWQEQVREVNEYFDELINRKGIADG